MLAKWQGLNMQEVYVDWAERLGNFSLGAINNAIILSKERPHPPNQGEFAELCMKYTPPVDESRMIGVSKQHKEPITEEEIQKNLAKIKDIFANSRFGKKSLENEQV